ncbi:10658_t:CDS:2, partial [Acaulospora colombiana]
MERPLEEAHYEDGQDTYLKLLESRSSLLLEVPQQTEYDTCKEHRADKEEKDGKECGHECISCCDIHIIDKDWDSRRQSFRVGSDDGRIDK